MYVIDMSMVYFNSFRYMHIWCEAISSTYILLSHLFCHLNRWPLIHRYLETLSV
jgi:hypothetical protein